jgi:hypothetical protein
MIFHDAESTSRGCDRGEPELIVLQLKFNPTLTMANVDAAIVESSGRPIELSFPLPKSPDTRIYIRLTIQATSLLLLTTAMNGDTSRAAPLGSFVYALPDVKYISFL